MPPSESGVEPLLAIRELKVYFALAGRGKRSVRAVDGVTLDIYPGENLGLVGESGCGKSTLAARFSAYRTHFGEVFYRGRILRIFLARNAPAPPPAANHFQDPYASLNPA